MFFIGIMGVDATVKPMGQVSLAACPACGRPGNASLAKRYSYFHLFFIPLVRWNKSYIATCPCCASVFALDPVVGQQLARGEARTLQGGELTVLRNNSVGLCRGCGAHNPSGSSYCNHCGQPL